MLTGRFDDADEHTPTELRTAYERLVAEAVESVGVETAAAETGIDAGTVRGVVDGDSPELTLDEAAALLGLSDAYPDADAVESEARDVLLLGMTTAVLDVDRLASELGGSMDPKEIQQKVEGRYPLTLSEYAELHHTIEASK